MYKKLKLWYLEPIDINRDRQNPWRPGYDKAYGFVIRAYDESHARMLAATFAGNENHELPFIDSPWQSEEFTLCAELTTDGGAEVILRDYRNG